MSTRALAASRSRLTPNSGEPARCTASPSQLTIESALRRHTYPTLGDKPLSGIKPSDVQAWVKRLSERLAPRSVILAHGVVAGVFKAATRDRLVASNPCDGTRLPKVPRQQIEPLPTDTVWALVEAVPPRYRGLVILACGRA